MNLSTFKVTTDAVGHGQVEVNGDDVSNRISGVSVVAEVGRPTLVTLRHVGTAEITGEGVIQVVSEAPGIADWLAQIDPDELEQAALAEMSGLGGGSTGAAMLEVLRRWAGGSS